MLTTALPLLPPPATSLLPELNDRRNLDTSSINDGQLSLQAQQQQQRRARGHPHAMQPRSQLAMLAYDERVIAQRKLAIQMYGYSWLKPAGCLKTMLGRREEEIEREEVEKQLRDAEMQERAQAEMEEAQRQAQLDEQRSRELDGEVVAGEGERDLDEDVPDADNTGIFDEDEDEEDDDYGADEDEVDLDADIPEGNSGLDFDASENSDTETRSEADVSSSRSQRFRSRPRSQPLGGDPIRPSPLREDYSPEDDLDDELPDMDMDAQDLDNDVPDADQDDDGWEHTDTELDESDMDISIMPPGVTAHHLHMPPRSAVSTRRSPRHNARHSMAGESSEAGSSMRRTSGNIPQPMLPPARPAVSGRGISLANQLTPNLTPGQFGSDFSVSALISTGNTDMSSEGINQTHRDWLDPASARRNLFGAARNNPAQSFPMPRSRLGQNIGLDETIPSTASGSQNGAAPRQTSSGGLFTPSPQLQNTQRQPGNAIHGEPQSRTRSGRVIGRFGGGRA